MKFLALIIILLFLCGGVAARAQISEQTPVPEKWQLTLDGIKSKAQSLGIENDALRAENQKLSDQAQKLQQSMSDQQNKNEQMGRFLKERHGTTDQQVRIEELTRMIKTKSQEARTYEAQLGHLKKKKSRPGHNAEDPLKALRKQLEDESTQEVLLENQLRALQ